MARTIGIGHEDFSTIIESQNFYIDKTSFIRDWWETNDKVTLITRPGRFGKTLNMSMLESFFSVSYTNRGDLFKNLKIWKEEKYRRMQGTYPVLFLSFAGIKENSFAEARKGICRILEEQYNKHDYLLEGNLLNEKEKAFYQKISTDMSDSTASASLRSLSDFLVRYYGKKVLILLDEYDTPMQEAYVNGYWMEMVSFTRGLFHSAFKSNPYLERAIMTGITRISKESVFSDLNNLEVVTTTSDKYAEFFGFTEEEVFAALDEFGLSKQRQQVKEWYDGFTFGNRRDIYNPWSIINFLDKKKVGAYWANTSSKRLVSKLVREGSRDIKEAFESLLLAGGYLKVRNFEARTTQFGEWKQEYELELTNFEVKGMFCNMIRGWFGKARSDYNDFIKALLQDDIRAMNTYMNKVAIEIFSFFDTGKRPSGAEPERFYHGFVLGLMVDLTDRYVITSNRESGFGRYDVMLAPRQKQDDAIMIEFKVQDAEEKELSDTVQEALRQIDCQNYAASLIAKGIAKEHIRKYGFAFCGKKVLIGNSCKKE